ncbi:Uncharacterized conserved protein, DUF58 family, contains vWF domain [Halogranum gelatinilyticum]|uniref:Uncharacterized conserved protein, DUF58 family, contains vWF domain n=1 Tax=Halogranum gelatinilyticum TaxID=660521 RepID=A0A1G9X7E1_9EURY|nr:DUF58 domain-containing protein [Halogranum gelatinilyticum]SDM92396.1 Uncharacterized conserved protein, DUF58 family, contains vWF domain [Halogranum gelatinilyticum]
MEPTRHYWALLGLGALCTLVALVADRPLAFGGTVTLGAVLLVAQRRAGRDFVETDTALTTDYSLSQSYVSVDDTVFVTMTATRTAQTESTVTVTARLPAAADSVAESERQVRLPPGTDSATVSFSLTVPLAGRFTLAAPRIEFTDEHGLFTESYQRGPTATLTAEPRAPRNIHVGQGGEQMLAAYGEHPTNQTGSGLTPAGLRQYVPGDTLNRIDWKATARQGYPHVREFELETDRTTVLVFDHRAAMDVGPDGQTMLDFAREVALGFVGSAESYGDSLGFYAVGDSGLTVNRPPGAATSNYGSIRNDLNTIQPTRPSSDTTRHTTDTARPTTARQAARNLDADTSAFAERLRPFFTASDVYVERIEGDPLFETVRRTRLRQSGQTWTILLTDDTERNSIRETVRLASESGNNVLVFLTPTALFESSGLSDMDEIYQRYVDFEEFRRELHQLPRVTAFEVGPGDHLDTVLQRSHSESAAPEGVR